MSEVQPSETERAGKNAREQVAALSNRVAELERVVTALVRGMKAVEDDTGEAYMPAGTYQGVKFDE